MTDELRNRALTSRDLGFADPLIQAAADSGLDGKVLVVDDRASSAERIVATLSPHHRVTLEPDPQLALFVSADEAPDLVIVSMDLAGYDGLRVCSQLRSLDRTRHISILVLAEQDDSTRVLRALDLGVNDYLVRPVDRNELLARVRTQVRRKRYGRPAARDRARLHRACDRRSAHGPPQPPLPRQPLRRHSWTRRSTAAGRCRRWCSTSTSSSRSTTPMGTTPETTCCASSPNVCAAACAGRSGGEVRRRGSRRADARHPAGDRPARPPSVSVSACRRSRSASTRAQQRGGDGVHRRVERGWPRRDAAVAVEAGRSGALCSQKRWTQPRHR